jgi:hypothetical protein
VQEKEQFKLQMQDYEKVYVSIESIKLKVQAAWASNDKSLEESLRELAVTEVNPITAMPLMLVPLVLISSLFSLESRPS